MVVCPFVAVCLGVNSVVNSVVRSNANTMEQSEADLKIMNLIISVPLVRLHCKTSLLIE